MKSNRNGNLLRYYSAKRTDFAPGALVKYSRNRDAQHPVRSANKGGTEKDIHINIRSLIRMRIYFNLNLFVVVIDFVSLKTIVGRVRIINDVRFGRDVNDSQRSENDRKLTFE